VAEAAPQLITMFGIGVDTAGQLLITVGDNPGRVHSEAAFAMLCGGVSFSVCAVRCCWFERR
jgi:transposase